MHLNTSLTKLKEVTDKLSSYDSKKLSIEHVVSYISDDASTQRKFNSLEESGKQKGTLIANKCSMHLWVHAQVKAVAASDGTRNI